MAITENKRKRIWEMSDKHCTYCHTPLTYETMTVDHIIPQSAFVDKDGEYADDESNLCVACKTCNCAKAAMSRKAFKTFINTRNSELQKLEAERRSAIRQAEHLSQQIDSKRFDYIHYIRSVVTISITNNW